MTGLPKADANLFHKGTDENPKPEGPHLPLVNGAACGCLMIQKKHLGLRDAEVFFIKFWESFAFGLMF